MTKPPDERPTAPGPAEVSETGMLLPPAIDPTGVPRPGQGQAVAILLVGGIVALLALITTLGWIVYNHV